MKKKILCIFLCLLLNFTGLIKAQAENSIIICADYEILPSDSIESTLLSGIKGIDTAECLCLCPGFYFCSVSYHGSDVPSALSDFPGIILTGDPAEQVYNAIEETGFYPDCLDVYIKDEFRNSLFTPGDFGENVHKITKNTVGNKIFYRLILNEPDHIKLMHLKEKINALPFTEKTELIKEFSGGIFLTEPFIYLDADSDGFVSAADARIILRISVNLQKSTFRIKYTCDCDKDGILTSSDARKALRTSVGIDPSVKGFFPV